MTLYRRKLETVEAFHYEAALETMDFKYPFPDWLKDMVTVRENAILHLDTDFRLVRVKPGQWVVKDSSGNLHIYWTQKNFTKDMRLRVTNFCDRHRWRGCPSAYASRDRSQAAPTRLTDRGRRARCSSRSRAPSGRRSRASAPCRSRAPRVSRSRTRRSVRGR